MKHDPTDVDAALLPSSFGRFAFAEDEGFRVVFRRADGTPALVAFWLATLAVLGVTLAALLREPEFNGLAWGIAGLIDFTAIYVFHALRKGASRGGLIVDGAERRVFLPQGAELTFERLRCVGVRALGERAELVLVHDAGEIAFGPRPAAEVELAATAVSRVAEVPLVAAGALAAA